MAAWQELLWRGQLELGQTVLVLGATGASGRKGAVLLCSFWLVSALARAGRYERAEELFHEIVQIANDLGLLAESVDPRTGELLGNFPQAFSHFGLTTAAFDLDRLGRGALKRYGPRRRARLPRKLPRDRSLQRSWSTSNSGRGAPSTGEAATPIRVAHMAS